jgi:hypothetical protein
VSAGEKACGPLSENLALYRQAIDADASALIRAFLRARAPVFAASGKAAPPLCEASKMGNVALVNDMLESQKDLPAAVLNRCLADAAQSGNLPLVELWLDKSAYPRAHVAVEKESDSDWIAALGALAGALVSGNPAVLRRLLEYKLDVNAPIQEEPVLAWAVERGGGDAAEIVKLLVEARADVNGRSRQGATPLFSCLSVPAAIKPLIAAGADIEARDQAGNTPLIYGAFGEEMVRELLANGANPAAVSNNGDTALQRAEQSQCKPCAALIEAALKKKADAN